VTDATTDQDVHANLIQLLRELEKSFTRMQNKYVQLATSVKFAEKKQCSF